MQQQIRNNVKELYSLNIEYSLRSWLIEEGEVLLFIDYYIDLFSQLLQHNGLNVFLQLLGLFMEGIETTHLVLIFNQAADKLLATRRHQSVLVLRYKAQEPGRLNLVNFSGNIDDEIRQSLDLFLVTFKVLHQLGRNLLTRKL